MWRRLLVLPNRNSTTNACAWRGGCVREQTSLWRPAPLALLQPGIEDANDLCPGLLPPGPPLFIFGFIPACLSGVGLKGAGWTRTENDISTRTTQSRATRERGHLAAALTCLSRDTLAKLRNFRSTEVLPTARRRDKRFYDMRDSLRTENY